MADGPIRKCADIDDQYVIDLAQAWRDGGPGVVAALMAEGAPEKVALRKVERLIDRGHLECGTSPYFAWPTTKPLPLARPKGSSTAMADTSNDLGNMVATGQRAEPDGALPSQIESWGALARRYRTMLRDHLGVTTPDCMDGEPGSCGADDYHHALSYMTAIKVRAEYFLDHILHNDPEAERIAVQTLAFWRDEFYRNDPCGREGAGFHE